MHRMGSNEPDPAPNWEVKDIITQLQEELNNNESTTSNIRPTINFCAFTPHHAKGNQ